MEFSDSQINNNKIYNNRATYGGGGISIQIGSNPAISGNEIFYNRAKDGGGVMVSNSANTQLRNNLLYKNSSTGTTSGFLYSGGGAISLWGAPILCENCTFYGNSAVVEGGAIQCAYTSGFVLRNCIFWANTAASGTNIYLRFKQGSTEYPSTMAAYYSDWDGGKPSVVVDANCTFTWGTGNFSQDPLFANTAEDDYHLRSHYGRWNSIVQDWTTDLTTSPCIDAGDPASDWSDELWPHGERINVGGYGGTAQASMSSSTLGNIADFDHDGKVDALDMEILTDVWLSENLLLAPNLNRTGPINFLDVCIFADNWLWTE